jgi:hypothetical protein
MNGDLVTLVCPPGAEQALVSFGSRGFRPFMLDPDDPHTPWLVKLPAYEASHFLQRGTGFYLHRPPPESPQ